MSTNQDETLLERYQREEEVNKRLEQDAQAPIEEPELPTPAKCEGGWGESCVYYYTDTQMQAFADAKVRAAMAQQATVEEPELPEAAVNVSPCDPNNVYWNAGHPNDGVNSPLFTATQMHDHYQAGVRAGMGQSQDGLSQIISGAIFDFAGYLTTRTNVIEVGSTANASPVADLVKGWAALRGLQLDDPAVRSWQKLLAMTAMQGDSQ